MSDFNLSLLERVLLFFAKTDIDVYKNCPRFSKSIQISFGVFVLLTGLFAFISGTYASSFIFWESEGSFDRIVFNSSGYIFSPVLGLLYSIMIIAIDREIVSAKNKSAALLRFPLAIIIGLIVSLPIELKLLEGRIQKQLKSTNELDNSTHKHSLDSTMSNLEKMRMELRDTVKAYEARAIDARNLMQQESRGATGIRTTGKLGKGQIYLEDSSLHQYLEGKYSIAKDNLSAFMNGEYKTKSKFAEETYMNSKYQMQLDLLSRYEALKAVEEKSPASKNMSRAITLLFVLFEVIPSLFKLITPATEYDSLLEARRRLNIQLIHSLTNYGMEELDADPMKVFRTMSSNEKHAHRNPIIFIRDIVNRMIFD